VDLHCVISDAVLHDQTLEEAAKRRGVTLPQVTQ
jgi:hypothetical protein